jgi:hypothetical protein
MDLLMIITKALSFGIMAVVIIGGAIWFGIILIRTLDEVNEKLGIIVAVLRPTPEVKNNEKDNEGSDSGSRDDGGNSIAY